MGWGEDDPHTQPAISFLATTASRFYRIDRAQVSLAGLLHPQQLLHPTHSALLASLGVSRTCQACSPQPYGHNALTCLWLWITCPHPPGMHRDGANRKKAGIPRKGFLGGWKEGLETQCYPGKQKKIARGRSPGLAVGSGCWAGESHPQGQGPGEALMETKVLTIIQNDTGKYVGREKDYPPPSPPLAP